MLFHKYLSSTKVMISSNVQNSFSNPVIYWSLDLICHKKFQLKFKKGWICPFLNYKIFNESLESNKVGQLII